MKTCSRCSAVFFEPAYGRVCQRCLDRDKEAKRPAPKPPASKPAPAKPAPAKPAAAKSGQAKLAPTVPVVAPKPAAAPVFQPSLVAQPLWEDEDTGLVIHDPRQQAKGLLAEAEKLLEEATKLDPDNAKARENLAQVRTIRRQVD